MERVLHAVASRAGMDYLFNNAGMIVLGGFRDTDYDQWRRFIDTDIMSVVDGILGAYKLMIGQDRVNTINNASVSASYPSHFAAHTPPWSRRSRDLAH